MSLQENIENEKNLVKTELEQTHESQLNIIKQDVTSLNEEIKNLKKAKHDLEVSIPAKINLEQLPQEAVHEIARFYRKANQYEKLYSVLSGKLNLSQEKYNELQKKYFEVCRELALLNIDKSKK